MHGHSYKGHKHSGHSHQGRVRGHTNTSYMDGLGGKDPHVSAAHHEANKAAGAPEGLAPMGEYDGGDQQAGKGMGENCCYE